MKESNSSHIAQGYIFSEKNKSLRIRYEKFNFDNSEYYTLTVKTGSGVCREEIEFPITKDQFKSLWESVNSKLAKTRDRIWIGNYVAELDTFHGTLTGLELVEVEFTTEEEANEFIPPDWFGEDVTNDSNYNNAVLSRV